MAKKAPPAAASTNPSAEEQLKALLAGDSKGATSVVSVAGGTKLALVDPALLNATKTKSGVLQLALVKDVGEKVDRFSELDAKITDLQREQDEVGEFLRGYGSEKREIWNTTQKDDVSSVKIPSGNGQTLMCTVKDAFSVNDTLARQAEMEFPKEVFGRLFEKEEKYEMKSGVEPLLLKFLEEKLGSEAVAKFFEKKVKYKVASGYDRNILGLTSEQLQLMKNCATRHKPTLKVAK